MSAGAAPLEHPSWPLLLPGYVLQVSVLDGISAQGVTSLQHEPSSSWQWQLGKTLAPDCSMLSPENLAARV